MPPYFHASLIYWRMPCCLDALMPARGRPLHATHLDFPRFVLRIASKQESDPEGLGFVSTVNVGRQGDVISFGVCSHRVRVRVRTQLLGTVPQHALRSLRTLCPTHTTSITMPCPERQLPCSGPAAGTGMPYARPVLTFWVLWGPCRLRLLPTFPRNKFS